VAIILTLITGAEVWIYYTPFSKSPYFNPLLIMLSVIKFGIVVQMYMHLRYDHKLFRALFFGPLIIAMVTVTALLFLFHQLPPLF
jgi:cytochrome c oxidase subunit 4